MFEKKKEGFFVLSQKELEKIGQPSEIELELNTIKQTFNLIPPVLNPTTLEDYKQNKIYELKISCNQTILEGFYSSCRGVEEFFTFSELDQTNIMGYISMLNSDPTIPIIWKSATETICTPFTSEQMIRLAKDGLIHKQDNIYRFELLRNQVVASLTIEEVELITWEDTI